MVTITVTSNVPTFLRSLDRHGRQVPYAMAVALTRTAKAAAEREMQEIGRVFDRPIDRTRKGIYATSANRETLEARVGVKDSFAGGIPVDRYLAAEIMGGERRDKRSERALSIRYPFLSGQWVPGPGVKLNGYGNVASGTMQRILADVQAQNAAGYNATRTAHSVKRNRRYQTARYFVPLPGTPLDKIARGVWVRKGKAVMPALIFVRREVYPKRFDFFGVGEAFVRERYPIEFDRALGDAFRTATD